MNWFQKYLHRRAYSQDIDSIHKVLERHLEELKKRKSEIPGDIFDVTVFLLEENMELYLSIITLYKQGRFRACLPIARIILENFVNLEYIYANDSERRAKNFISFAVTNYLKRANTLKDMPAEVKKDFAEMLKNMELEYQRSGKNMRHWDGKNFREICDELKLTFLHTQWYTRLSGYTHSEFKRGRDFDREGPYNEFLRDLVWKHISIIGLQAIFKINSKYNLTEDVVVIKDYPHPGATFFFAVNERMKG